MPEAKAAFAGGLLKQAIGRVPRRESAEPPRQPLPEESFAKVLVAGQHHRGDNAAVLIAGHFANRHRLPESQTARGFPGSAPEGLSEFRTINAVKADDHCRPPSQHFDGVPVFDPDHLPWPLRAVERG